LTNPTLSSITLKERSMLVATGLALLVLGVFVWLYGDRFWLLGAGAGALLGIGLLTHLPRLADGLTGFVLVAGLALLLGILGLLGKAFGGLIVLIIGFVAGGGLTLGLMDTLGADMGFLTWLLALTGAVLGAALCVRFYDWSLIILASWVGSALIVRGIMVALLPSLAGPMGGLIVLALTVLGILYHYRRHLKKMAPVTAPTP
jgi:hypothetical protein